MPTILPDLLAITLYLLASGLLAMRLAQSPADGSCKRTQALISAGGAILIHGMLLYHLILTANGLNLGFFSAASLIALITALLLLLAALFEPVENLGIAVFPVAALTLGLLLVYPEQHIITGATAS